MKYTNDAALPKISDEEFAALRASARSYCLLILKKGPTLTESEGDPQATRTILEHGKRNAVLRAAGLMPIICPVRDDGELAGIGIFDAEPEEVERIYADDPAIQAGLLTYEIYPCWSFPGSTLP